MTPIPPKLRKELEADPFMKVCIHKDRPGHVCDGRLTWEHAFIYARKRINEKWAIVPCCWGFNVGVTGKDKRYNKYIALCRASKEDLAKYPKVNWDQEFSALLSEFNDPRR